MFSTIFLLLFVSFYLQYNTSRRVKKRDKPAYLTYMERRVFLSGVISLIAAVLALWLLILQLGAGAGAFGFAASLMCAGGLVVTLAPFRYLKLPHIAALYLGLLMFETLIL